MSAKEQKLRQNTFNNFLVLVDSSAGEEMLGTVQDTRKCANLSREEFLLKYIGSHSTIDSSSPKELLNEVDSPVENLTSAVNLTSGVSNG